MTTEELRIIISASGASQTAQAIKQVSTMTNDFNLNLGKLYGTLAKFMSIGLIGKFAKDCVNTASDLQEVANVMDVTFGDKAAMIDKWAKTQAASFGLSETAAKRYAGNIGTMAKQFGFTTEQAAAMATQLTKLTGDVSSFYNLQDSVAYTKLKSIFTGETESLKELGVVMTEAQLNAYAMQQGIGKQVKEMTEGEKVMLRYNFVTEKLSHASGDFARTSDGWANSVRTFKLELENLKIKLGNELLPVAAYGLSVITDGLKVISPVLEGIAETVRIYTDAWRNADDVTKAYFKTSLGIVAVMVIAPKLIGFISGAVKLLTIQITTLGGALMAIGGIVSVLLVGAGFAKLAKQIKDSGDTVKDLSEVADSTSGYIDTLADSVNGLSDSAKGLDLFLASFDEVNKVSGNSTLMSSLVNADDLDNILNASSLLEDLQNTMKNADFKFDSKGTIFDPDWWKGLGIGAIDFIGGFVDGEWFTWWEDGAEEITKFMEEKFPEFTQKLEEWGGDVYDTVQKIKDGILELLGIKEKPTLEDEIIEADLANKPISETVKFFQQKAHALDYNTLTAKGIKNSYALATGGVLNTDHIVAEPINTDIKASNAKKDSEPINFSPTLQLLIDGEKIAGSVIRAVNQVTRSNGKSPFIEMG